MKTHTPSPAYSWERAGVRAPENLRSTHHRHTRTGSEKRELPDIPKALIRQKPHRNPAIIA
jgi:hypothetical protein